MCIMERNSKNKLKMWYIHWSVHVFNSNPLRSRMLEAHKTNVQAGTKKQMQKTDAKMMWDATSEAFRLY